MLLAPVALHRRQRSRSGEKGLHSLTAGGVSTSAAGACCVVFAFLLGGSLAFEFASVKTRFTRAIITL